MRTLAEGISGTPAIDVVVRIPQTRALRARSDHWSARRACEHMGWLTLNVNSTTRRRLPIDIILRTAGISWHCSILAMGCNLPFS